MINEDIVYDIAIIGAGVVGTAIAQELSKYNLQSILLEAKSDVGAGTSKANTAIWHTGFDAKTGSLEQQLLRDGYDKLVEYVPQFGIPHEKSGAVLIAWNEDQLNALNGILEKAHNNNVSDVRTLTVEEVYKLEPHVNSGALGGLLVPGEFIICPFSIPLSYATQAVLNGVTLQLNFPVTELSEGNGIHTLSGSGGSVKSKYVINAAGLNSDVIDALFGFKRFKVTPRRGELIVFDKLARDLVNHILLPVPTSVTKGVLVSPTVFGNIMLGPTAEDLDDKEATNTSEEGINFLWQKGEGIISQLLDEEITSTYAGLRAATEHSDYQIYSHPNIRYICVGGIRSTGLSSSLGIAAHVLGLLSESDIILEKKQSFKTIKMPYIGQKEKRPYESEVLIESNEEYGKIICHCERVTLGEIKDALSSPIPAKTLEGLRRRTRGMQGRCQGFYCSADIQDIFDAEIKNKNVEASSEKL